MIWSPIMLPFLPADQVETLFELEFGPPQLHHEEKIFKGKSFAIPVFGMSDKICSVTNAL